MKEAIYFAVLHLLCSASFTLLHLLSPLITCHQRMQQCLFFAEYYSQKMTIFRPLARAHKSDHKSNHLFHTGERRTERGLYTTYTLTYNTTVLFQICGKYDAFFLRCNLCSVIVFRKKNKQRKNAVNYFAVE